MTYEENRLNMVDLYNALCKNHDTDTNRESLSGARVIKPITDVNYGICYGTTVEKFPLKISVIYGENKLNS